MQPQQLSVTQEQSELLIKKFAQENKKYPNPVRKVVSWYGKSRALVEVSGPLLKPECEVWLFSSFSNQWDCILVGERGEMENLLKQLQASKAVG